MATEHVFDAAKTGRLIKRLREIYNLRQADVADGVGVNRSHMTSVEKGTYRMPIDRWIRLRDYFREKGEKNLTIDELVEGEIKKAVVMRDEQGLKDYIETLKRDKFILEETIKNQQLTISSLLRQLEAVQAQK